MTIKRLIISMILIGLAAGFVSANGVEDNDLYDDGDDWISGHRYRMERNYRGDGKFSNLETETYSGIFDFEDETYPVLETEDGSRYYLAVEFPVDMDDMPANGDELEVEAFPSWESPVTLIVMDATVNGEPVRANWRGSYERFGDRNGFRGRTGFRDRDRNWRQGGYGGCGGDCY